MALTVVTDITNAQDTRSLSWNCGTCAVGDIIVVNMATEDSTIRMNAPTATGVTFTQRVADITASQAWVAVFTGVVTGAGAKTVTATQSVTPSSWTLKLHGGVAVVCPTADGYSLAGSPVTTDTRGTGAPSAAMTCTANSLICAVSSDWAAVDGSGRTYRGTTTEDGYQFKSGVATAYFWHQTASSGSNTIGLTAPAGQTFTVAGVEVLGPAAAGGATANPVYVAPSKAAHHAATY